MTLSPSSQWARQLKLLVATTTQANQQGTLPAIDFSQLEVRFQISRTMQSPCIGTIEVWNPAPGTVRQIPKGSQLGNGPAPPVLLMVGYGNPNSVQKLFSGTIVQSAFGRVDATTTKLRLAVQDGDALWNNSVSNQTLSAGWSPSDKFNAMMQSLTGTPGVQAQTATPPSNLPQTRAPRGRVLFGNTKQILRRDRMDKKYFAFPEDGQIVVIPYGQVRQGVPPVTLNAQTGMVGVPEVTTNGVVVRSLINTNYRLGGPLSINNNLINPPQFDPAFLQLNQFGGVDNTGLSPTGSYYIVQLVHVGDTRGNDWYSEMVCWTADASAPPEQAIVGTGSDAGLGTGGW